MRGKRNWRRWRELVAPMTGILLIPVAIREIGIVMLGSIRLLLAAFVFVPAAFAQDAELEILKVDFGLVDQAGASDPWFEIAVAISVERGDGEAGANPRFADNIDVSLSLATQSEQGGGSRFAFYSATAEYPTLEVGRHMIRFYLPPELVKRDRVRGEPFGFEAQVRSGESILSAIVSRKLEAASALESFRARIASSAEEGLLRLQNETPFGLASPRDTPNPRLRIRLD